MMKTMQNGNYLAVGGLVVFKKEAGFLNAFLNVEMCSLMGMTAGGINNKKPLLANGTNFMFSKEAFIEVKGYEGDGYASGDDVFLVQKIAKKYGASRIGFNNEEESIVATQGVTTLSALFHQRARWAGKSKAYSFSGKFTTLLLGSFNILMALLIILAIFQSHMIPFVFAMFFLKLAADTILTLPVLLRTNQIYLMKYLIPVALLYPFYILGTALLSIFVKPVWKGRSF
jgi:cellulose synthase/poly-beta-1,6-N-acetylglucosamine synthase-like glycosyltransferase